MFNYESGQVYLISLIELESETLLILATALQIDTLSGHYVFDYIYDLYPD